jgi:hypothetical protein
MNIYDDLQGVTILIRVVHGDLGLTTSQGKEQLADCLLVFVCNTL